MKEKKNAVITFRTETWIKDRLQMAAEQNKWSVAQTVEELCKKFVANPQPERIIIKTTDLIALVEEIKKEGTTGAVELFIDLKPNKDETDVEKVLSTSMLMNGGRGLITGFTTVTEMKPSEIKELL